MRGRTRRDFRCKHPARGLWAGLFACALLCIGAQAEAQGPSATALLSADSSADVGSEPQPFSPPRAPSFRGLLAPREDAPARVAPGGRWFLHVRTGTGLTPPPGLQEPRAHRGFGVRLCARGLPLGAEAYSCFALPVRDVRPVDSHSLVYRVEVPLPAWVAPWVYDVGLRFPGGSDEAAAALIVEPSASGRAGTGGAAEGEGAALAARGRHVLDPERAGLFEALGSSFRLRAPAGVHPAYFRVHLGPGAGVEAPGAAVSFYPRVDDRGAFSDGALAIVQLAPGASTTLVRLSRPPRSDYRLAPARAYAGQTVELEVLGVAEHAPARVFWWLGAGEGAIGARVPARFVHRRPEPVGAVVLEPDGRATRLDGHVDLAPRRVASCGVGAGVPADAARGLLFLVLSWTLGARWRRLRR